MLTYQDLAGRLAGALPRALRRFAGPVIVLSCGSVAVAQQRTYLVELGAAGAYQSFDDATDLGGAAGGLGRIGVWLPLNFSLEVEGSVASPKTQSAKVGVSVKTFSASALYNILVGTSSSIYLKGGFGSTKYGSDCPQTATPLICGSSGALVGGAGFRIGLSPVLMVRAEGTFNRNKSEPQPPARPVTLSNFGFNLGLSYMLGSKPIPDSDGDGILNNRDRCPDTPAGAQVDQRGCSGDSDNDGVPDGVDRC
ncbi:MAG: outer membrane beta-barrel protein, partial [Gemmatimonadales bacterium]